MDRMKDFENLITFFTVKINLILSYAFKVRNINKRYDIKFRIKKICNRFRNTFPQKKDLMFFTETSRHRGSCISAYFFLSLREQLSTNFLGSSFLSSISNALIKLVFSFVKICFSEKINFIFQTLVAQ